MTALPAQRRHLAILRAGDNSLHSGWIAGPRDFDLFISYYGNTPDKHRPDADLYEMRKGPKWSCIADLLAERPELLDRYDTFWFPDDDLAADTATLNQMLALFHGMRLSLAQPALTRDSYFTWKLVLQEPGCVLRYSSFVEVMAPLFSRDALKICLASLHESRSGWGLDWVWAHLIGQTGPRRIAILDATPVKHTRPVGGELYKNNPEMDPRRDDEALVQRYALQTLRATAPYRPLEEVRWAPAPWTKRLSAILKGWNAGRRARRRTAGRQ